METDRLGVTGPVCHKAGDISALLGELKLGMVQ